MTEIRARGPLFDADGALSRAYLLDRGYCCGNGCRNCPYGSATPATSVPSPAQAANRPSSSVGMPKRIVSLCPSNTEVLHALGLLPRVVGIDNYSDWPPEICDLPRLGRDLDIDMDRVQALHPDLVVASLSVPGMERNVLRLRELGLPAIVLDSHSLGDVWQNMRAVGAAVGVEEAAEQAIADLQSRIQRVREALAGHSRRPRFYWEWWPKPLVCPGGRNWLTTLSELAGGVNITAFADVDAARPTLQEVADAQPDFIFLVWTGVAAQKVRPELVLRRPGWESIPAVQNQRVFVLEEGLFCRPSPRLIDGLEYLARLVHPERFQPG